MKIKDVIKQLDYLRHHCQEFSDEEGDIWNKDVKALEKAIEIIKRQIEKDEVEMLGKVWINMEYHRQELDRLKNAIDFNEYQRLAQRTCNAKSKTDKIINGVLGLNGESGEVTDIVKKYYFQGHELDKDKIIDELGDVMWYIAEICTALDVSIAEVAELNIEKLKERYPDGFESERSVNREK